MKLGVLIAAMAGCVVASAQNINLTNTVATVTTLDGKTYRAVTLAYGDLDGIIWRSEASGGRVCYTNLTPEFLESLGISTNRIETALARAQHKVVIDARYRALAAADAQAKLAAQQKAQAEWAAGAPAREREAQRAADLVTINAAASRIAAAKNEIRRAEVVAHDANHANAYNDYAPTYYVKESARYNVEQAQKQLATMRAQYEAKYGTTSH